MFDWLKKKIHGLFSATKEGEEKVVPLVIEGTHTTLTAEPDDAELAAMALLESLSPSPSPKGRGEKKQAESQPAEKGTAEYYRQLAERIESAHAAETRLATRFVAYVEQELRKPVLPEEGAGSLAFLETGLYKRLDTVEREGGELKQRWQHCLADVTVRLMEERESPTLTLPEGKGRELSVKNRAATESQLTEK